MSEKLVSLTVAMDAFSKSTITRSLQGFAFTQIYFLNFLCRPLATTKHGPLPRNLDDDPRERALLGQMNPPEEPRRGASIASLVRPLAIHGIRQATWKPILNLSLLHI